MKSHAMASSQPPPSAKPLTAAITGLRTLLSSSSSEKICPLYMSMYESDAIVLMSAPAAKALLPLPVTTMAPISGSASSSFAAATSSFVSVGVSAFSCFSRLSVMSPTPPGRLSDRISLYAALPLLHQRARVGDHLTDNLAAAMRFMWAVVMRAGRSAKTARGGEGRGTPLAYHSSSKLSIVPVPTPSRSPSRQGGPGTRDFGVHEAHSLGGARTVRAVHPRELATPIHAWLSRR